MITRFWWVRHAPTHAKGPVGHADIPADLTDRDALQRLDSHLPAPAVLVSSDLRRATATADALTNGRRRIEPMPDLRELNFGAWEGLPYAEIARRDPTLSRAFWEEPGDIAPPQGESWNQVSARVDRAVSDLRQAHTGQDIVAVAHFAVILAALQRASGIPVHAAFRFQIDNLSVTRLDYLHDAETWRVGAVNHRA